MVFYYGIGEEYVKKEEKEKTKIIIFFINDYNWSSD